MMIIQEEKLIQIIRAWIRQTQQQTNSASGEISEDTNLIASGVLDSLGLIELIVYLETVTEEKIDLNDVDPSEFTTIRGLCKSLLTQRDLIPRG